jgi:hypothetical protein
VHLTPLGREERKMLPNLGKEGRKMYTAWEDSVGKQGQARALYNSSKVDICARMTILHILELIFAWCLQASHSNVLFIFKNNVAYEICTLYA